MAAATAYDKVSAEELEEARRYSFEVEWSDEDDAYIVSFPDAPGVMTHGSTVEEAATQAEDAIITWLTARRDAGRPVPPPSVTARTAPAPPPIPDYQPEQIRDIRRGLDVSQPVFAAALGVSKTTVQSWEQGLREPEGSARRLIHIAEKNPDILMGWATADCAPPGRIQTRRRKGKAARQRQRRGTLTAS